MPVRFIPSGQLDIATDPTLLPEAGTGEKMVISEAMTRCTNLHLDKAGVAATRWGSSKINHVAIDQDISLITEFVGERYSFAGANLYRDEVSIATGLTDAEWSSVTYNSINSLIQNIYALNGTDRKRIYGSNVKEWGIEAPTIAPAINPEVLCTQEWEAAILVASQWGYTVGNYQAVHAWEVDHLNSEPHLTPEPWSYVPQHYFETDTDGYFVNTSEYGVKYTYVRKEGDSVVCESNPSPETVYEIIDGTMALIVYFAEPPDSQITHIRFYRTLGDQGDYYYDSEVAVENLKWALLTKTDAELGSEVETTHDRPPFGTIAIGPNFGGTCFILKDNLVYFCLPNRPEYWPADYYVEASTLEYPLMAGTILDTQLYVGTKNELIMVQGTGSASFFPLPLGAITGTQSKRVFLGIKGHGLFHLGNDGLYQYTGGQDNNITNAYFRPLFQGETVGSIPGMNKTYIANCWLIAFKSKVYFAYPGTDAEYCDNMLVIDLVTKKVVHYQYPVEFRVATVDYLNQRILAADANGHIWHIEDQDLEEDEGDSISWQVESKEFTLFKKIFPRYARYDVEVGGTAAGYIKLNGVARQTHTLNGNRLTRKRLVDGVTGDRLSIYLAGTGTVAIHKVDIE